MDKNVNRGGENGISFSRLGKALGVTVNEWKSYPRVFPHISTEVFHKCGEVWLRCHLFHGVLLVNSSNQDFRNRKLRWFT